MAQLTRTESEAVTDGQASIVITAGAYTAGDVIGGLLRFPNVFISSPGKGEVRSIVIFDNAKQAKALKLFLFKSIPSVIADNAAFNPSAADARLIMAEIPLVTHTNYSTATIGYTTARTISIPIYNTSGQDVYAYLVADVAPTYAAIDDLSMVMSTLQDAG